jgi:hypothetical protein
MSQVSEWLETIGLAQYADAFHDNHKAIIGAVLRLADPAPSRCLGRCRRRFRLVGAALKSHSGRRSM